MNRTFKSPEKTLNEGDLHRVLVVHNAYRQLGGEDSVVESEISLLRERGHGVGIYRRHNDEILNLNNAALALQTVWSRQTVKEIADQIGRFQPDVIHAHNTHPLISPSLYWAAARSNVPVVQTLHNFRLVCPQAMLLRDGHVCEDCLGRAPWRAVVHKCYRDSFAQSVLLAGMLMLHRKLTTYRRKVTRYIALSEFSRKKFIEGGLPENKISVKPNFVDIAAEPQKIRTGGLYVGRISNEKGINMLLVALKSRPGIRVDMIGDGPLQDAVASHPGVNYRGWQDQAVVEERMRAAEYLVLPSIWYEGFPRTLVEAFACGLPVLASRLGSMAELVKDGYTGLLFEPASESDLADKIAWAVSHPVEMRVMGENARREYEAKYTPQMNYRQLMEIYNQAISEYRREQMG